MPLPRRPRACKPLFGKSLKDFKGLPQLFRDLMMELKQWMSLDNLFAAENQAEKVCLMRQAWDMGKDPLVIMRSSPHAVSCRSQPQVDVTLYADSETLYALAGALKLWLECLPEPLISPDLARILVQATCCLEEQERLPVMQQVLRHVEGRELQVLYPLLEFLHHHRLNAIDAHALADTFAPLIMRPQLDTHFSDAEHCAEAYGLLTDLLIHRYRTLFSGIVTAPRVELVPEASPLPAQQPAAQRGTFGGREAVARLFGRTDASADLPPVAEALTRSQSLTSGTDDSADSVMLECASQDAESAGLTIRIPASMAEAVQRELSKCGASEDVSFDVESLLSQSLDSMLFGEDDSVLHEAFTLPAQQGSEASMGAISQRSDSMGSIRSEDSCEYQSGACYDHLERHSPTSLLPEHPFSPPVLKDEETCKNHPYLHASMWMAPLPHEDSHIVKGKSGAPLGGCHHDVSGHAGARGLPMMPNFGSWAQVPVLMHM